MNKMKAGFLIGAATAAHQVEGNNIHSDYWAMEHMKSTSFAEPSLDAVDHYNRYEEDIQLMADAGLNAYRFSVEWARIEPEEGKFDDNEVEHYRQVILCCKKHNIEPIVTLLHFTSPAWLMGKGGWEDESVIAYFARYCAYVTEKLGSELNYVCTINEANMGKQIATISKRYIKEMLFPKKKKDADGEVQVGINLSKMLANRKYAAAENMEAFGVKNPQCFVGMRSDKGDWIVMLAHQAAVKTIKEKCPDLKVGITLSLHDIQAIEGGEKKAARAWDDEFVHYLPYIKDDDFLGVQNYTRDIYGKHGLRDVEKGKEMTQMSYEFYPQGLEHVIKTVCKDFKGDIIVTENGIATEDDSRRVAYIQTALQGVQNCIAEGYPVKGYMHWSLMDNFEWQKGFGMKFGLIAVDRKTQKRTPKESLKVLGSYVER